MKNIVVFGPTQSGKTTLLGYLATAMLRNSQFNEEVLKNFKLIKKMTPTDEFKIGDPSNPVNVQKDIILPSFISLDRDELRKFRDGSTEGSTKRIHRKQLSICMTEGNENFEEQNENESIKCVFTDIPGFRQRLSDKYLGFFEGEIGIAVIKLKEILELERLSDSQNSADQAEKARIERRLFEPLRIWCDYRSPGQLMIVISQIDQEFAVDKERKEAINCQIESINTAINCIKKYLSRFNKGEHILISPISIKVVSEPNQKHKARMKVFFRREGENVYTTPHDKHLPGDGTLISCLKRLVGTEDADSSRPFSMANVYRIMRTKVGNSTKPVLSVLASHGSIHKTDVVTLGPVLDKRSKEKIYVKCAISSLKADGLSEPSNVLLEGNVGGIIFQSLKDQDSTSKVCFDSISTNSSIKLLKTTILFRGDFLRGDIVRIEIYRDDYLMINGDVDRIYNELLTSVMPYDMLNLFWYGKKIEVNVVEMEKCEDRICLGLMLSKNERDSSRHFALPCNENREVRHHDSVLVSVVDPYYTRIARKKGGNESPEVHTYFSARITGLAESINYDDLVFTSYPSMNLTNILSDTGIPLRAERKFEDGREVCFVAIKSAQKNYSLDSELPKISRNIRKWYNRENYRNYGGINLTLYKRTLEDNIDNLEMQRRRDH